VSGGGGGVVVVVVVVVCVCVWGGGEAQRHQHHTRAVPPPHSITLQSTLSAERSAAIVVSVGQFVIPCIVRLEKLAHAEAPKEKRARAAEVNSGSFCLPYAIPTGVRINSVASRSNRR
jgi:hypothetical protein